MQWIQPNLYVSHQRRFRISDAIDVQRHLATGLVEAVERHMTDPETGLRGNGERRQANGITHSRLPGNHRARRGTARRPQPPPIGRLLV